SLWRWGSVFCPGLRRWRKLAIVGKDGPPFTGFTYSTIAPSNGLSALGPRLATASRASFQAYFKSGECVPEARCHDGSSPLLPYSPTELFNGLVNDCASCANGSKKIPSNMLIRGISRPSSHTTGPPAS